MRGAPPTPGEASHRGRPVGEIKGLGERLGQRGVVITVGCTARGANVWKQKSEPLVLFLLFCVKERVS